MAECESGGVISLEVCGRCKHFSTCEIQQAKTAQLDAARAKRKTELLNKGEYGAASRVGQAFHTGTDGERQELGSKRGR